MAAQRVLVVLLSCTALFAAGFGQKIFMGQLTSNGKPIGNVYAISRKTMRVENFNLDLSEAGTDVVWMFGYTGTPSNGGTVATYTFLENGLRVSQPMMVVMQRRIFKNESLEISLPQLMDKCGESRYPDWAGIIDLTMGTHLANLTMNEETIKNMNNLMCLTMPTPASASSASPSPTPPACNNDYGSPNFTCTKLANGYGLCWTQVRKYGKFILCSNETGPGKYMAFGWSRNLKKTTMIKADAVVCSHHINGTWDVEDYYLESRQPCGTNQRGEPVGACPDTAFGEASNILGTSGSHENGVGYCTFKRWLYSSKKHDRKVTVKKQQAMVWAIGPIGADGQIQKHSKRAGDTQFFSFVGGGQHCGLGDAYCCCNSIIQEEGEQES